MSATTDATFDIPSHFPQGVDLFSASDEQLKDFGSSLVQHLKANGYAVLKRFPITQEKLDALFGASEDFFDLPLERKESFKFTDDGFHGYVSNVKDKKENEIENNEAFNMCGSGSSFPDSDCPQLRTEAEEVANVLDKVRDAFIKAIALVLGLNVEEYLVAHHNIFSDVFSTCLRVLHYPAIESNTSALRIKEHADWTTITFGFQSNAGGLEVKDNKTGEWKEVVQNGTDATLFCGKHFQLMTANAIPATIHRAVIKETSERRDTRRCIICFCVPDSSKTLTPSTALLDSETTEKPKSYNVKEQNQLFAKEYYGNKVSI